MQIGIHSGSAIAGVIGYRRIQYDLVGDAVKQRRGAAGANRRYAGAVPARQLCRAQLAARRDERE